ncbi:hypothetical protein B0H10DRAFT_2156930 [Mycena sp. CBHHK59/15]|nr:hypothetical protein B0H10DRAFT_2156930 [Mycena sp. CBHHK59/15]
MVPPSRPRLALCLFPWRCVAVQPHVAILFHSLCAASLPCAVCGLFALLPHWRTLLHFHSPLHLTTIWRLPLFSPVNSFAVQEETVGHRYALPRTSGVTTPALFPPRRPTTGDICP